MSEMPPDTLYSEWDTYGEGWLNFDKTSRPMMKEILECLVGKRIAQGTTRTVFECKFNSDYVLKFQNSFGNQNAIEVHIWDSYYRVPKIAKWLAPVVATSSNNRVIMQRRTTPLIKTPKNLPNFLTDRKVQNYGMLDGRVVCHDYGLIPLIDVKNIKMEPAEWWDGGTGNNY